MASVGDWGNIVTFLHFWWKVKRHIIVEADGSYLKIKNSFTLWPNNSTSGCIPKRMERVSERDICINMIIRALFKFHSQNVNATQLSTDE